MFILAVILMVIGFAYGAYANPYWKLKVQRSMQTALYGL